MSADKPIKSKISSDHKRGRGRPPHEPTDASRKQVEALASYGVPHDDIARIIGIGDMTLRKYYANSLATAAVKANSMVAQSLFNRATKGDGASSVSAAIFWSKTRARWREHDIHEITGPKGGPIQTVNLSNLSNTQLAALEPVLTSLAVKVTLDRDE